MLRRKQNFGLALFAIPFLGPAPRTEPRFVGKSVIFWGLVSRISWLSEPKSHSTTVISILKMIFIIHFSILF